LHGAVFLFPFHLPGFATPTGFRAGALPLHARVVPTDTFNGKTREGIAGFANDRDAYFE
jgi:hypothetical protein